MNGAGSPQSVIAHCKEQARFCRFLGSRFTAELCDAIADDIAAGGVTADLTAGWPGDPRRDALSLRIAGYLHHSVLTDEARDLAALYPGADADWTMARTWPAAAAWLTETDPAARAFLASPPQTNEVRRSIALLPAFLQVAGQFSRPMHLLELGASAGLNQNWDKFSYKAGNWSRAGASGVSIDTDWRGPPPAHLDADIIIQGREACDQNPIDVTDAAAARRLKCYVWPDQPERLSRLDAAVALAAASGTRVDRADAAAWLRERISARPVSGLTVVFHSVFLQYPPAATREAIVRLIEEEGAAATPDRPLAWVNLEPVELFADAGLANINPNLMVTRLKTWPGGDIRHFLTTDGHVTRVQVL